MKGLIHDLIRRHSSLLAAGAAVLLLLAGIAGAWVGERDFRDQRIDQARAHARVLAASVSAALAFQDSAEAQRAVDVLNANPDVTAVGVYDAKDLVFARRASADEIAPEHAGEAPSTAYVDGRARATERVIQDGNVLGSV